MKNLILTMAIIIFAIPLCAHTLELNKVLSERKAIYEICKMSAMDVRARDDNLTEGQLENIIRENLRRELPNGNYKLGITKLDNKNDFTVRIFNKDLGFTYSSTSL